jgi:mannose-1-phosphate guanylyltransferase
MQEAIEKAKNGFIVTFGIVPTNQKQDTDILRAITYFLSEKPNQVSSEILAKGKFCGIAECFLKSRCFIRRIEKYTQKFMRNQNSLGK